jgi:hypothetical protein
VAALVAGGCGDGGTDADGIGGEGSSSATTGGDQTTTPTSAPGFGMTPVSTPVGRQALLSRVEAVADGGVDRITFEFEDALPGYRVEFVERPIIQDGSGDEIEVEGAAVLGVHFEAASGFDLSGEGRQVYQGPPRLDLTTRVVLDVVRVSDFEANLDWAIGLDVKSPFRVRTESAPTRVIVEVQAPPAG